MRTLTAQQMRKQNIRAFMQLHYTDERLAWLLAHARAGKLIYDSCCCYIGITTSDHALRAEICGHDYPQNSGDHLFIARRFTYGEDAEDAFQALIEVMVAPATCYGRSLDEYYDATRRRIIIPMVRAEMKRRSVLRAALSHRSVPTFDLYNDVYNTHHAAVADAPSVAEVAVC